MPMKLQGVPNIAPSMNNVFSLARNEAALAWTAAAAGSPAPPVATREYCSAAKSACKPPSSRRE
eukprot:5216092-Pyramimonas_sp.AAC.1